MEYITIPGPTCQACDKEILSPADCLMESFRLGFPIHTECSTLIDRFLDNWKRFFGTEYAADMDREVPIGGN